ncbi:MAG: hypothetical protein J4473_00525 [Candidatus Aenigmarchaeota archaeon]|nr:hypothetical protein [Candidatus Aenigmarchaeota archaeon]
MPDPEKSIEITEILKDIEKTTHFKKLPIEMKNMIKNSIEESMKIRFPISTFKENNEWIATTPLIDICAQGETEKEAIESIIEMIDDYMSDPCTKKPNIETIIQVKTQNIPINLPIDKIPINTPISKEC